MEDVVTDSGVGGHIHGTMWVTRNSKCWLCSSTQHLQKDLPTKAQARAPVGGMEVKMVDRTLEVEKKRYQRERKI